MDQELQIVRVDKPEEFAWGIIGQGVSRYNREKAGDGNFQRLCFVLEAQDHEIVGGMIGELYWGWFYLDLLWVREDLRDQGFGSRLLLRAEEEAQVLGAENVYMDTFSFQALEFYQKNGYEIFGELEDFPVVHQRYFLKKSLTED